MTITITEATRQQALPIAQLIMQAMDYECCLYFAGPQHTLHDFEAMMTRLVEADDSQYSYRNALMAVDGDGHVAGVCVSYDGKDLHRLRKAFVAAALEAFGRDYSDMDDETQSGELYIDSLAVDKRFRRQGIARQLLEASKQKARKLDIPAVGLLVDKGNPDAERLYKACGFKYVDDSAWGGHPMRHLQCHVGNG